MQFFLDIWLMDLVRKKKIKRSNGPNLILVSWRFSSSLSKSEILYLRNHIVQELEHKKFLKFKVNELYTNLRVLNYVKIFRFKF